MKSSDRKNDRRNRRRVAVITGTRAEYGLLRSTIAAIDKHPGLQLQLVVTGMHLLKKFGYTVRDIEEDGWPIDARVPMQRGNDQNLDQARGLALGIKGIGTFLEQSRTDVVLVLGDRIEAMAGALAATTTGRFLAHVHGGDVAPGDMDDRLRDGITKLSHIHLPATKEAARRIIKMGESSQGVFVVGAPGLDDLYAFMPRAQTYGSRSGAVVLHHASGRSPGIEHRVMSSILGAVRETGLDTVVIYPNTDRGHSGVLEAIEKHVRRGNGSSRLQVVESLSRSQYLQKLCTTRVLIGNSSSGVIEAPAAGTPSVNVGERQEGRLRGGQTVLDVTESAGDIRRGLCEALNQRPRKRSRTPYGDGHAGQRIAEVLARKPLTEHFRRKKAAR